LISGQSLPKAALPSPATFSVLLNENENARFKSDWLILKEIASRKNINFSIRTIPDNQYGKMLSEVLSSGTIPDIVLKVWPEQITGFSSAGILLPISDYEHLMPNFQRYIQENNLKEELDALKDEKGKYYILPGFQREIQVQQWIYRKDLFDRYKIPTPKTYDDLYRALLILKEKFPSSKPISACWGGAHLFAMMGAGFGIPAGWNGDRLYDKVSDSWKYSPATRNWQEMVRFLAQCYKAGLLDPDVFTQEPDLYYKKLVDNTSFVTVTWISSGFSKWDQQLADNGYPQAIWEPLMVLKSPVGIQALPGVSRFRKGTVLPVRVIREPYFRRLLEFLDWIYYSNEGQILATWGVAGTTFSIMNNTRSYLPTIRSTANPGALLEPGRDFGLAIVWDLCELPDFEDSKKPPKIAKFLNDVLSKNLTEKLAPTLTLSLESINALKVFSGDIQAYSNEMLKSFITGQADIDKDWNAYVATLEKMGFREMEKIWNVAWKGSRDALKKR
jgi:putative aldouronate transport system substrate-binding protein